MRHEEDFRMATMNVSLSDEQKRQAKQDLGIKLREALLERSCRAHDPRGLG